MKLQKGYYTVREDKDYETQGCGATIDVELWKGNRLIATFVTCPCGRGCGNKDIVRDDWGYHDTALEAYRADGIATLHDGVGHYIRIVPTSPHFESRHGGVK